MEIREYRKDLVGLRQVQCHCGLLQCNPNTAGLVIPGCLDPSQQLRLLGRKLLLGQHPFLVQLRDTLKGSKDIFWGNRVRLWERSAVSK